MHTRLKYSGTALPTDSNTFTLFSTQATGFHSGFLQHSGTARVVTDIKHSHNGTFKWYKSDDGGTNWNQIGELLAVGGGATSNTLDALCEGYRDFKVDWVNGGTTQTTFEIDIALTDERTSAA